MPLSDETDPRLAFLKLPDRAYYDDHGHLRFNDEYVERLEELLLEHIKGDRTTCNCGHFTCPLLNPDTKED